MIDYTLLYSTDNVTYNVYASGINATTLNVTGLYADVKYNFKV